MKASCSGPAQESAVEPLELCPAEVLPLEPAPCESVDIPVAVDPVEVDVLVESSCLCLHAKAPSKSAPRVMIRCPVNVA